MARVEIVNVPPARNVPQSRPVPPGRGRPGRATDSDPGRRRRPGRPPAAFRAPGRRIAARPGRPRTRLIDCRRTAGRVHDRLHSDTPVYCGYRPSRRGKERRETRCEERLQAVFSGGFCASQQFPAYRVVIGQPRQDELLALLDRADLGARLGNWAVDLSPPAG